MTAPGIPDPGAAEERTTLLRLAIWLADVSAEAAAMRDASSDVATPAPDSPEGPEAQEHLASPVAS